jgi:putative transposase
VLDDYSRYVLSWRLCSGVTAEEVKATVEDTIRFTGVTQARVVNHLRLLSDNGPCYLSGELREYLHGQGIGHTRSKPFHPMAQGKIERYHRSMKSVIRLDNYYSLEAPDNVAPADLSYGRVEEVLARRERIRKRTMNKRRRLYGESLAAGA